MSSIIEIIFTLSLGEAAVERNFSLGKSFVIENISKKLIKDHTLATKMTAATIHVRKEMHSE